MKTLPARKELIEHVRVCNILLQKLPDNFFQILNIINLLSSIKNDALRNSLCKADIKMKRSRDKDCVNKRKTSVEEK